MLYDCRWNVWINMKGTLGQRFQVICPREHHVRDGKYLMVMLAELVMSRTYFLPLILSCWMLSPPSNMQSPHFCAYTMHVLQEESWEMELKPYEENTDNRCQWWLLVPVECLSVPHTSSVLLLIGPAVALGREETHVRWVHFFSTCLYVPNSQLLQPCKYHKTCVRRSKQSMQDGGIERLRETGGRGRGQGEGACTVTESIKDEKGLGRSLKGLIK